jgi:hypothetical protein
MFWLYFVRPLQSLWSGWQVKLPISLLIAAFWSIIDSVVGTYTSLLSMPAFLLGMASLAFIFDFLTAVLAAWQDDGWEGISLLKFRQLLVKAAYWVLIIAVASNLASGAERAGYPLLPRVDVAAVMWLTLQDSISAVQNWKGKEGAAEWFQGALDLAQGDLSLDQITSSDSS